MSCRLVTKVGNDNFRVSNIEGVIERFNAKDFALVAIYDRALEEYAHSSSSAVTNRDLFIAKTEVTPANLTTNEMMDAANRGFIDAMF